MVQPNETSFNESPVCYQNFTTPNGKPFIWKTSHQRSSYPDLPYEFSLENLITQLGNASDLASPTTSTTTTTSSPMIPPEFDQGYFDETIVPDFFKESNEYDLTQVPISTDSQSIGTEEADSSVTLMTPLSIYGIEPVPQLVAPFMAESQSNYTSSTLSDQSSTSSQSDTNSEPHDLIITLETGESNRSSLGKRRTSFVAEDQETKKVQKLESNRRAARKSREKKKETTEKLEKQAAELEATNKKLKDLRRDLNDQVFELRNALLVHEGCPSNLPLDYLTRNNMMRFAPVIPNTTQPHMTSLYHSSSSLECPYVASQLPMA